MKITKAILPAAAIALAAGLTACGSTLAPTGAPRSVVTVTAKPTPAVTKTVTPTPTPTVTKTVAPAAPAPVTPAPQLLNAQAVVTQYYADINAGDYADAWNLGGDNIGGSGYYGWVAGYGTTASVSLNSWSNFSSNQVTVQLVATQDNGAVYTYTGTYTVQGGVIVSANIVQNS